MNILSKNQIEAIPEWLPIQGFEGLYEVNCREGIVRNARTLRVLKPSPNRGGYPIVGLNKDEKRHTKKIHRLVALTAFNYYGIPTDGLLVLHLDETRTNSCIDNLGLGTCKENLNFEQYKQRRSKVMTGKRLSEEHKMKISEANKGEKNHWFGKHHSEEQKKKLSDANPKKRAVGAFKDGRLILKFESTREAGRNGFDRGNINACCRGKYKTHKGYEWKYLTA